MLISNKLHSFRNFTLQRYTFLHDLLPKHYIFLSDLLPQYYIFLSDLLPKHYEFWRIWRFLLPLDSP